LFDEPLSNLDAKLRVQMRTEISKLHKQLGATMIYVTHDQTEAMTMGDRIVVMKDGIINQVDTPMNLYNKPTNKFVAGFIGSPAMNFIEVVIKSGNKLTSKNGAVNFELTKNKETLKNYINKSVSLGIRPEDIQLENIFNNSIYIDANIDVIEPMGNETFIHFVVDETQFIARIKPTKDLKLFEKTQLFIDANKLYLFDPQSGDNIV
jgi:multiple sugar transport system ATP-binding protein